MYPPRFFFPPLLLLFFLLLKRQMETHDTAMYHRLRVWLDICQRRKRGAEWKHVWVQSRKERKVCPRWQIAQTPVKLHAGQCRNNGLIKERLSTAGSLRVLGSCVGWNEWESGLLFLLIKFRSRRLTESGVGRGERTFPIILAAGSNAVNSTGLQTAIPIRLPI